MQWLRPLSCPSRGMPSICKPGGTQGGAGTVTAQPAHHLTHRNASGVQTERQGQLALLRASLLPVF